MSSPNDRPCPAGLLSDARPAVAAWKHQFAAHCQSVVNEQVFGARLPSHRQLMELDKKIRDFYLPPSLRVRGFGGNKADAVSPTYQQDLQSYCAFSIREISALHPPRLCVVPRRLDTP